MSGSYKPLFIMDKTCQKQSKTGWKMDKPCFQTTVCGAGSNWSPLREHTVVTMMIMMTMMMTTMMAMMMTTMMAMMMMMMMMMMMIFDFGR